MAQLVKILAAKPDNLRLITGFTYEGEFMCHAMLIHILTKKKKVIKNKTKKTPKLVKLHCASFKLLPIPPCLFLTQCSHAKLELDQV